MAASIMGGDFVEAYVLKNAYKEKVRRMEEAQQARNGSGAAGSAPGEENKARHSGRGGGLFGLMKKKVHPRAAGSSSMETSSGASS